jgi:hypothetical protein
MQRNPVRPAVILALTTCLFLLGCASDEGTHNERHLEKLMRNRDWPRIQQVAEKEVKKREILWPDAAAYLPVDHKEKIWLVNAQTDTRNSGMQRTVVLTIADDGTVMDYQRYWDGKPVPSWPGK